ncbi:tubulin polymerization-promoting protein family member 2 isoform X2 [Homo sapiens]|nr:tubulin polymerization-promoting protein family member 2 isoform X2 [Homo sapiens]|eukprot:XP_011534718.1 tubulin polymerization-promoting protein family member 2 isoform X2 [Homo sapiens]
MASEAEKTFHRFAAFGESSSSGTEMNNKNFSKLCKDCGIMDGKTVTSTDVDIVFSKVKAKNARTITFQQFKEAVKELGQKRFKGKSPDEVLENIYGLMEGKDPATTGATWMLSSRLDSTHTPTPVRLNSNISLIQLQEKKCDPFFRLKVCNSLFLIG